MSENVDSRDVGEAYFVDFIPNHIKQGITKYAEESLRERFERGLSHCIARWGELSAVTIRVKPFELLFRQARHLYVDGCFEAVIALCGMTIEALCISIAQDRVLEKSIKKRLTNPRKYVRSKVKLLKKYFKGDYSASLLNDILDIRRKYLHLHETRIDRKDVIKCVNKLHLVLLAEYSLIPEEGRFRVSTKEDVEKTARKMDIVLE